MNRSQQCILAAWQVIAASYGEIRENVELGSSQWSMMGGWKTTGMSWNKGSSDRVQGETSSAWVHPGRGTGCPGWGDAVQSPSLYVFKTQRGKTLSNLVWSHSWPYLEQHKWLLEFCYPSDFCSLILLHIFGYLFLCKYFDNIHLTKIKTELLLHRQVSQGEKKNIMSRAAACYQFWTIFLKV